MKKKIYLSESELVSVIKKMAIISKTKENSIKEQTNDDDNEFEDSEDDDYNPRQELIDKLKSKIESEEEFDESDIEEIYSDGKPFRSGRGSIYIDVFVPETDDKEFDRKVALKMLDYYSKIIKDENYVGGVGFKNRGNLIQPYDNMDF
jgi:hypothetical protein